jgi:hypothetical protein
MHYWYLYVYIRKRLLETERLENTFLFKRDILLFPKWKFLSQTFSRLQLWNFLKNIHVLYEGFEKEIVILLGTEFNRFYDF